MGGIGKTTLAETVFHRLSSKFEASCFLKNVRENSEKADGLNHLEQTLLKEILKEEGLSIGSNGVRERLSRTKVLIVLDDVSSSMQMERLAGSRLRFGTGSRIIITTRDRGTFGKTVEEDNIYKVEVLKSNDAVQLFNSRAFKDNSTCRIDYKELVEKAVAYAKGVPLALTVLGSLFFNCKSKEEWEDEFNKLKRFPCEDIQKVLRISYDKLGDDEKDIFLDIACFHTGESVVEVKRMLDVRGFFAISGIRILIEMSLISIVSQWGKETIEMHDLLQEMGRKIVQQQDIKDPGKRSRLFNVEDVNRVLRSNKETPNVEAIQVNWCNLQERPLERADFKKMSNLIMLIVDSGKYYHKLTTSLDLPDSLRYLKWRGYPLESLPSNFCPKNLVELHMQASEVKKLWKEEQILFNLQVINLRGCESLVEIPSYFQHLDKLTHLDLECCRSLKYLPKMPGNIQYLNLDRSGIKELPESVWSNKNISCLNLNECGFMKFPSNWCKFKNIEILNLRCCYKFENFPEILESMEHLKSLRLSYTAVIELPSSICELKYLERLDLHGCSRFSKFPEILKPMEHLKSLSLRGTAVTELPSSICELKYLERLDLTGCYRFSKFPEILKPMEHLVSLCLEETAVEMLPSSIGNLNGLQDLELRRCYQLKDVPTSIYSLTNLKRLDFFRCLRLEKLPSSSAGFLSLEELELSSSSVQCGRLEKLPSSSVGFLSLEELDLSFSGILEIPASIKQASRLSTLDLEGCKRLQSIPELPVLCNVNAQGCTSLKKVSSSRTALTLGWDKPIYCCRVFLHCPRLNNNSRSNIMDEAQIAIMRMTTVAPLKDHHWLPNPWPQITIACPGKETPNWFSYQNEGSSIDIELCPDWFRTGLFGFALSVVVLCWDSQPQYDLGMVRANFIVKFMGESHELFSSAYSMPEDSNMYSCDGQHHVHVWSEAFRSEEVGKHCSPDVYKLAKEASVVFCLEDAEDFASGSPIVKVESCGICPLYAEDAEKFKFGHVFMSRGPKVGEETRQDDHSKGGGSGDEPQVSGFSKFPEILMPMEHLVSLCLEYTAVEMLPSSIGNLNGLQDLNLRRCYQLKDVPTSIYSLSNLKRLNFNDCGRLEKLPSSSVGFISLEELDLSNSGILEIPASIKQASRLSILNLNCCDRLQSIPELPVLCNVKASNCTSLKIVSSSRTALAQGWDKPHYCFRVFTNCAQVDNNSRSNIMDEAQITIMRMATVAPLKDHWLLYNPWPQINIVCPGIEIPKWFRYQNEGSSVYIELYPDWFRTGLFGFALSVVLSEGDWFGTCSVRANFIVKFMGDFTHELFSSEYIIPGHSYDDYCDGQHQVHVWNEAFRSEEVGKNCSPDVYKLAKEASVVFCTLDSEGLPASDVKVERCGICPLYAEDAEKFKFGHVFMWRGPKVGEETRQDDFESNGTIGTCLHLDICCSL
ncbi:hypothetical protein C1H46_001927 [Malus baccata]|uniref:ADP-ribosyl cyclase/cyclic ADP-ribose hydrolase n=1 Tax=Malus baccata TaxID=106549 RepID=A0A540NMM0_MALBA|nr:hypothetical protein C1H46_001927 [Malus baccata]